jgi:hypothetical protein
VTVDESVSARYALYWQVSLPKKLKINTKQFDLSASIINYAISESDGD